MFDVIVEGMLIAIDRLVCGMRPATDRFIDWVRDSSEPYNGLELRSPDGALYTGLAMLERSRVVLMLAIRVGQAPSSTPLPNPTRYDPPARFDPAPSSHSRDLFDDPGDGWPADPYHR